MNGPCRNRTYNLLVAGVLREGCGYGSANGGTPADSRPEHRNDAVGRSECATNVQRAVRA